ncbi:MAG: hypothetical protein ACR2JR_11915 [Rubrobacteraceae bacterium]
MSECRVSTPWVLSPKLVAAMLPAVLVTIFLCCAGIRRSALLRSAGFATGGLAALVGLVLSLVRAFT